MFYYDRVDVSEGIDINKTHESKKECNVSHYWCFLSKGFKFQPNVCNECHDLLMISMNLSDIAILNIKSAHYCCIISGINKSEAMNLMQFEQKMWKIFGKFIITYKMSKDILTFSYIEIEKNKF